MDNSTKQYLDDNLTIIQKADIKAFIRLTAKNDFIKKHNFEHTSNELYLIKIKNCNLFTFTIELHTSVKTFENIFVYSDYSDHDIIVDHINSFLVKKQ